MKDDAYLICKKNADGVFVPQVAPIVLTGGDLTFDDLNGFAESIGCIVVLLSK